ncbi:hypothetical protein BaRGS_00038339, partial [Batillaria attramentaria]
MHRCDRRTRQGRFRHRAPGYSRRASGGREDLPLEEQKPRRMPGDVRARAA